MQSLSCRTQRCVVSTCLHTTVTEFLEQTQASPLTQRIQFLEAKGLTPAEIDIAIKQASATSPSPGYQPGYPVNYGPTPYPMIPPPAQGWDWRDYFASYNPTVE